MDIVARWRASTHDSRIFNESTIKETLESGTFKERFIGDSGYKLTRHLFTALLNPQTPQECNYNNIYYFTSDYINSLFYK